MQGNFFFWAVGAATLMVGCGTATSGLRSPSASAAASLRAVAPAAATNGTLTSLQSAYVAVVKSVLPSVVQIETDQGLGSGVIFDAKGDVVTNAHVVAGAATLKVTLSTGKAGSATLVGTYAADDLAVIHSDAAATIRPASFGDSRALEVGDIVMALGNPLGLQSSVTAGIVSAVGRTVSEGNGVTLPDTIQTSAEINPGNSGGALVNLQGQVIGIPTLAATDRQLGGGAAPGIGFAIPSSVVNAIATQLVSQGRVTDSQRAYMGVRLGTSNTGAAVISSVTPGSPAERAKLQAGDVITAINGRPTATPEDVTATVAALKPGDQARIAVQGQDGTDRTVTVALGTLPG